MPYFRGVLAMALVCLAGLAVAQTRDELIAQRVLGPHWKQISRSAGAIFVGTVVAIESAPEPRRETPIVRVRFHVDRAVAGAHAGQQFTLREWAGAWETHRPMRRGERSLIFLYPPSRLGLSSPVGGALGQVHLDPGGETVTVPPGSQSMRLEGLRRRMTNTATRVSIRQLERAILTARGARY